MPCRDWDDNVQYVTQDNPVTTQRLCACLSLLEQHGIAVPRICEQWWVAHKKEDALRIDAENEHLKKEMKKKQILDRLSAEERKILGL